MGVIAPLALFDNLTLNSKNKNSKHRISSDKILHSVCKWCYSDMTLQELASNGKSMGLSSIELLSIDEIKEVRKIGLTCAIANGSSLGITTGWNDQRNHERLISEYSNLIPQISELGVTQIICFSGNRNGLDDQSGLEQCARGLEKIMPIANKYGVTVVMELLNSKVDHFDYQCDHTNWGVALVEKLGSPNFKLLYDIYHMQIMEGDVIRTIQDNHQYISHYHTGGVPGRNEIDETQELNYKAIVNAIIETGYNGFIGQEFIPKNKDKMESLRQGIQICDL